MIDALCAWSFLIVYVLAGALCIALAAVKRMAAAIRR